MTAGARGTATVTVTADDGNGGRVQDTFSAVVKATPTVASALADVSGLATEATRQISLSGVFSDADGDSLTITAGSSDNTRATVSVAGDYSSLTVTARAPGTTTIMVTAQDSDGNQVSDMFGVEVVKSADASLNALSLSAGSVTPPFSPTTYAYTLEVGNDVSSTTVTSTANHGSATLKAGLAGSLAAITDGTVSGEISLAVGANEVQVEVTAEDGTTKQVYAITVTRASSSLPVIQFGTSTYSVTEGDVITIQLRLDEARTEAFRIWVRADGRSPASFESDYSFGDCLPHEDSCDFGIGVLEVEIPAGYVTYDYDIRTVDDHKVESDETFALDFAYFGSPFELGDDSQAVITIKDNDEAGVIVSTSTVSVTEDTSGSYTVKLDSQPDGWGGHLRRKRLSMQGQRLPRFVEFGRHDWDRPQTLRVRSKHDYDAVDEEVVVNHRIETSSGAAEYLDVRVAPLTVSVADKHSPSVIVENGSVAPAVGKSAGYRVYLNADPSPIYGHNPTGCYDYTDSHTVTVEATSSDTDIATVSPASATFTADDYGPKYFVVTGVSPGDASITHTVSGTDPAYTGRPLVVHKVNVSVSVPQEATQGPPRGSQDSPELERMHLPGPVLELRLTGTADSLTVSWSAPESGDVPTRYIVHLKPVGGGKGALKTPKPRKTSVTFSNLEAGRTYKVFVRAKNEVGKGAANIRDHHPAGGAHGTGKRLRTGSKSQRRVSGSSREFRVGLLFRLIPSN